MFKSPRLLFLCFDYFLEREIKNALELLEIPALFLPCSKPFASVSEYIKYIENAAQKFKPDICLTVNSKGLDTHGKLAAVLQKSKTALVSWFVDHPEHFLEPGAVQPENFIPLTCDSALTRHASELCGRKCRYMPLAADETRFDLDSDLFNPRAPLETSFVGRTWQEKIDACHTNIPFPKSVLSEEENAAQCFVRKPPDSISRFLKTEFPEMYRDTLNALGISGLKDLYILISWRANQIYRVPLVQKAAGFKSLIAGDEHWQNFIFESPECIVHTPIGYYTPDLARLFFNSKVNFTASSLQMPTALTQRNFDVPASGGLLLTDRKKQLEECFDPETETLFYENAEEIPEIIKKFIRDRDTARRIVRAARKRIHSEHTYTHRMREIMRICGY
ncbi:MAG: glycosyltransferase [Desulfovibrionales bacterium]